MPMSYLVCNLATFNLGSLPLLIKQLINLVKLLQYLVGKVERGFIKYMSNTQSSVHFADIYLYA